MSRAWPERGLARETLFWALNVGGWATLCVANIYVARMLTISGLRDIVWCALFYGSASMLSAGLRGIYRRADYRCRTISSLALITFPSAVVAGLVWKLLEDSLTAWLFPRFFAEQGSWERVLMPAKFMASVFSMTWPFMMWSILYFVINFWLEWKRERERAMKATLLAQKAQLQMLRYQLNPHFLFNALNSIRALVDENKDNARAMITELAESLRYTLVHTDYANVPLASEMEAIGHYLSIQSRCYEEKLVISTEISEAAGRYSVPCFLIHPLVENAIKYGMQTSPMPLRMAIVAEVQDRSLVLTVRNTGRWVEPPMARMAGEAGTGTGLENVKERLEAAFAARYRLIIGERDGWVAVTLEI